MNCEEARVLIHPLIDGELDAQHARAIEAHLESCASCSGELSGLRELQNKIAAAHLAYRAPNPLRRRIADALPRPFARPSRREWLKGFASGAGLSVAAASGAFLLLARNDTDQLILSDVISAHLRSLEPDHLTDVRSSDRHNVKPWFAGKLGVAPPVVDLTAEGFELAGGRLDAIGGRIVAAIVYLRRNHIINLFAAPAAVKPQPPVMENMNGFNIRHWQAAGVSLWAVGDINASELEEFSRQFDAALQKGT